MRAVCDVLIKIAESGKICENVMPLLPAKTCAPTPTRTTGLLEYARASLTSLIAPSTLLRSTRVIVSFVVPTTCVRGRLVSCDRSRNVVEPSPRVQFGPIGSAPTSTGKRAVVVLASPLGTVTLRHSGEYWKNTAVEPTPASAASLVALIGSKSAMPPPVPSARALKPPGGYPKPSKLSAPWAPTAGAKAVEINNATASDRKRITGAPAELSWCS